MRSVVTRVCMSMPRAGQRSAMMAMATERTARSGRVRRMTGRPSMVSQPSQSHDHEAGSTERQAKRIRIHKVTACKILRLQGVQNVPKRVGVLYPFCKRLPQTVTIQPSRHMVWYGE